MRELTEREEKVFRDAVNGVQYDREGFEKVTKVLRFGKANTPDGIEYDCTDWPCYIKDWRARKEWSINLLDRHQAASRAAKIEYWRVFTSC